MIYIITHKEMTDPQLNGYKVLLVGAEKHPELQDKYLCDNTGDNISAKNNTYCEMTGLYWMWKNTTDDILGLVHYRRFFVNYRYLFKGRTVMFTLRNTYFNVLSEKEIKRELKKYDMLVVKDSGEWLNENIRSFKKILGNEDICRLDNIILTNFPDYYDAYKDYSGENVLISKNMFVGKREVVNKYCEWIFNVLNLIEEAHYNEVGEKYSNRELGYFAEFLFGVWLKKNNINYKICNYENIFEVRNELFQRYVPIYRIPEFLIGYIKEKTRKAEK